MNVDCPRIFINDTTLRDGEQAPRVAFTARDKVAIAKALAGAGADEIEAGTPAMGRDEIEAIGAIVGENLPVRVMAWCRLNKADVDAALAAGVSHVNISAPMSRLQISVKLGVDVATLAERVRAVVSYARERGLSVAMGGEDSSRADPRDIGVILRAAAEAGAWRYRFADTLGALDPFSTYEAIAHIRQETDLPIEFHGHDDVGLATANTLAAIRAGATHASVTVLGLGERAGNAPLEEVAVALGHVARGQTNMRIDRLHALARLVAKAARRRIGRAKAIVGADVFTHESGIHVAALLKDARTYQGIDPARLGRRNTVVLAKHSGVAALKRKGEELGFDIDRDLATTLLAQIRQRANEKAAPMTKRELANFFKSACGGVK
ncbi:homocitrate synthase [Methylocystis parvus]|uniref:Homocitrate synthase n=1 Tax=Methylocystis parvus TaxID=134 RepID=A0A6B8M9V6_9HYPH|nr:homocitrate synthase [Methylocystis parvus]QGM97519.1 homocitrate synthase [Methylocystis parvus]QGM99398.1 homocitrate synthase [Methylocystis parvus]WBJ98557.1 homocitrate synthase [Methylocystis parvus OBBP]WBK00210.1 homocitrate synthase [Methylocystis parvus OBBP]